MSKRRKLPIRDRRPGFDLAPPNALRVPPPATGEVARLERSVGDDWNRPTYYRLDGAVLAIVAAWRATFENLPDEGVTQFRAGRRMGLEIAIRALVDALPAEPRPHGGSDLMEAPA